MKLFLITGTDDDDVSNNLDFFVVAHSVARATELWRAAVLDLLERPALDRELNAAFEVVPDASDLPIAAAGDRWIPWDEIAVTRTAA